MLQIKTIHKNTFRLSASYFNIFILPLLPNKLSEETTQRKHTHIRYNLSSLTITIIPPTIVIVIVYENMLGIRRFGCVEKDYEVGHLLFLFIPSLLLTSFCLVAPAEKGMNDRKKTGILFNSTFILRFTTISWREKLFFFQASKMAVSSVKACQGIWTRVSFWRQEAPLFGMRRLAFLSETCWKIAIFFIYFIMRLFYFYLFVFMLLFLFIYYQSPQIA